MARQTGDIIIEGTIDDLTFYKMEGKGYARKRSSLKGERVKKDPKFKRTMESAERLAKGSQLASKVYRSLPLQEQEYTLFTELKSLAIRALKEGKSEAEVLEVLQQRLVREKGSGKAPKPTGAPVLKGLRQAPALFRLYGPGRKQHTKARSAERRRSQRWIVRCRKLRNCRPQRATDKAVRIFKAVPFSIFPI